MRCKGMAQCVRGRCVRQPQCSPQTRHGKLHDTGREHAAPCAQKQRAIGREFIWTQGDVFLNRGNDIGQNRNHAGLVAFAMDRDDFGPPANIPSSQSNLMRWDEVGKVPAGETCRSTRFAVSTLSGLGNVLLCFGARTAESAPQLAFPCRSRKRVKERTPASMRASERLLMPSERRAAMNARTSLG